MSFIAAIWLAVAGLTVAHAGDADEASASQVAKACQDIDSSARLRGARAAISAARFAERADADVVRLFAAAFERELVDRINRSELDDADARAWAEEHDKLLGLIRGRQLTSLEPLLEPPSDVSVRIGWAAVANAVIRILASPAAAPGWTPSPDSDPAALRVRLQGVVVPRLTDKASGEPLETPPFPQAICGFYSDQEQGSVCSSITGQIEHARTLEAAGDCADLAALGNIMVARCPHRPEGFGLRADAFRCSGEDWLAAREYLHYTERGGEDAADLRASDDVQASLGLLEVVVKTDDEAGAPRVRLHVDQHEFRPDEGDATRSFEFHLLPPGVPLSVEFSGVGFVRTVVEVPPLRALEVGVLEQELEWLGEGRVRIQASSPPPENVEWRLLSEHRELQARDGDTLRTSAGKGQAVLEVSSPIGRVRAPLDVPAGGEVVIDPVDWTPAAVAARGIPAGSIVQLSVEGTTRQAQATAVEVAGEAGSNLLVGTNIALLDSLSIGGVVGGRGRLSVWHPNLGMYVDDMTVVAGRRTPATVMGTEMSSFSAYRDAWTLHQDTLARRTAQRRAGTAVLAASAAAAGVSAALLAWQSVAANREALDTQSAAIRLPAAGAADHFAAYNGAVERSQSLAVAAGIFGSTAGVMLTITVDFGLRTSGRLEFEPPKAEGSPDWAR